MKDRVIVYQRRLVKIYRQKKDQFYIYYCSLLAVASSGNTAALVGDDKSNTEAGNKKATSLKRQLVWDWKKGCASETRASVPEKKQKFTAKLKAEKPANIEKYYCLECLDISLRGKKEERFATLCRNDTSSISRHKARWHKTPESHTCTIVPSTAPEVKTIRIRYSKSNEQSMVNVAAISDPIATLEETVSTPVLTETSETYLNEERQPQFEGTVDPLPSAHPSIAQTTLLSFKTPTEECNPGKDLTLEVVMDAIAGLSLKVDKLGKEHATLERFVFEDCDTRTAVMTMRVAKNIFELVDASELLEFFYDEECEIGVLRCLPCFKLHQAAKPTISSVSPFQAQRVLNPSSNGTLGSGILLKKETTRLLINGQNQTWYRQKKACIDHLCLLGDGSKLHKSSMEMYRREAEITKKKASVASNIFRAAISDLKLGAAAIHFETLVSLLACCSVDVGNIGHSRKNFNAILYCLEKTVNRRISSWLNQPLPSTLLPPHIWATVDKATPSRTTNQAVLIVARNKTGIPCPIPVAAPSVYTEFEDASYNLLAKQLIEAITENFSRDIALRLCGVAADGPYQASGFRRQLMEILNIVDVGNDHLALPVTWDPAHLLNLAIVGVKDSQSPSGTTFRRFVKRCNVFNNILARGKGFAFLQLVDESAHRPVAYACQRFASSSYEQWLKIEKSYDSFWKAFEMLHPNRDENEEMQYMIAGSEFVADLLAFLDILKPVVDLMLRLQSLDTPIWKLKIWWPTVKAKLKDAASGCTPAFARLEKAGDAIQPGGVYKGVKLLDGWLVTNVAGKGEVQQKPNTRFTWEVRDESDVREDQFCKFSMLLHL